MPVRLVLCLEQQGEGTETGTSQVAVGMLHLGMGQEEESQ